MSADLHFFTPFEAPLELISEILTLCDDDFNPPLSTRWSTLQQSFEELPPDISRYSECVRQQNCLIVPHGGLISWRTDYKTDAVELPESFAYVTTVAVTPECRRSGVASELYEALFEKLGDTPIVFRTWLGNIAHISLAGKLGFELVGVSGQRGNGEETVWYKRG